jgi:hypothetical protein
MLSAYTIPYNIAIIPSHYICQSISITLLFTHWKAFVISFVVTIQ